MEDNLSEILAKPLSKTDALRNVARCVIDLTTVKRFHNGRNRSRTYNGDIDTIAGAARQLAEMTIAILDTDTPTNEVDRITLNFHGFPAEMTYSPGARELVLYVNPDGQPTGKNGEPFEHAHRTFTNVPIERWNAIKLRTLLAEAQS